MNPQITKFFEELTASAKKIDKEEQATALSSEIQLVKAGDSRSSVPIKTKNKEEKELFRNFASEGDGQLVVDVYETLDEIVVESTLAGVKPEDLDINITKNSIQIRGQREREKKIQEENFLYQECYWGSFSRTVVLPQEVDPDEASASIKNGILTIKIPKVNPSKSKKLKVKG